MSFKNVLLFEWVRVGYDGTKNLQIRKKQIYENVSLKKEDNKNETNLVG